MAKCELKTKTSNLPGACGKYKLLSGNWFQLCILLAQFQEKLTCQSVQIQSMSLPHHMQMLPAIWVHFEKHKGRKNRETQTACAGLLYITDRCCVLMQKSDANPWLKWLTEL